MDMSNYRTVRFPLQPRYLNYQDDNNNVGFVLQSPVEDITTISTPSLQSQHAYESQTQRGKAPPSFGEVQSIPSISNVSMMMNNSNNNNNNCEYAVKSKK